MPASDPSNADLAVTMAAGRLEPGHRRQEFNNIVAAADLQREIAPKGDMSELPGLPLRGSEKLKCGAQSIAPPIEQHKRQKQPFCLRFSVVKKFNCRLANHAVLAPRCDHQPAQCRFPPI